MNVSANENLIKHSSVERESLIDSKSKTHFHKPKSSRLQEEAPIIVETHNA
jgi:hypothetical protein